MFQEIMSPKVLNVEKLEKKFASLTKSRESILGLSTWIIRHKEFYKEIVDQWLNALCKDMNALTMFYVANDVIQNCGRKKAPEFREAFGAVLERAVSLEKVKEIKTEVIRMLTLWHERSIYDGTFYKKLQDKLNDIENSESEEELDEADIISNFKLEKLTDSLQKLRTLEEELLEKEEFLEDIEEPGMTNIDNLIVKMDSQKELRKVDKFQKLVENYLSLADKVMTAQKEATLNLKYSSIFYSAQLEDAKKVAHAYRIYGKKVKMLEKALSEKLASLPEVSPVLDEKSPDIKLNSNLECQSPGFSIISDVNNENSNQDNNFDPAISPKMNENESFMNVNILNEKFTSPLNESQNSLFTLAKNSSSENKVVRNPSIVNMPNNVNEEEEISKKHMTIEIVNISGDEKLKSPLIDNVSKNNDTILKSPTIGDATNIQIAVDDSKNLRTEKILKSPLISEKVRKTSTDQKSKNLLIAEKVRKINTDQKSKSPAIVETVRRTSIDKLSKCVISANLENDKDKKTSVSDPLNGDLEEKKLKSSSGNESSDEKFFSLETEDISSNSKKTSETDLQTLSDLENIDFLLEKSYNEQRTKSKASFKRKIDNLLKMKQSKTCKLSNDSNLQENKAVSGTSVAEESAIVGCSNLDEEKKSDNSESFLIREENTGNAENVRDTEKNSLISNSEQIDNSKTDHLLEITQTSKTSDSGGTTENIPQPTPIPFTNFPDIPTELLKNILDKHRTNMNQSSNTDACFATSELPSVVGENVKLSDSDQNNINYNTIANDKKDIFSGIILSPVLDSKTNTMKNIIQEDNTNINKDDFKIDSENVEKSHCIAKTTPLMENLQKLLRCFTEKESALNELKNSKTLKTLPTMSLRSTLKLYHVLKEHHRNDNALLQPSNVNNNVLPSFPVETTSLNNKSSVCNYNSTNSFSHSKNDNLEIMDMEVDSDDDTK